MNKVSVVDRGFLYGDGVFESLRTYNGKAFLLEEHIKRLLKGAKTLKIRNLPGPRQIKLAVLNELRVIRYKESYIKIIITRGNAKGHGLDPAKSTGKPTIIVLVEKLKELPKKVYETGWSAIISTIKRPDVPSSRLKTLCYVDAILAKIEAKKVGADEAFLLDENGNLTDGTVSNIFIVKDGIISTPSIESPILAGVTRKLVIKLAKESAFPVEEKSFSTKELFTADECFVTSSGIGIMPVTRIWKKKIGSGKPGFATEKLMQRLKQVAA
ncbi:MAG: aminotransferase class IV [bacterium]